MLLLSDEATYGSVATEQQRWQWGQCHKQRGNHSPVSAARPDCSTSTPIPPRATRWRGRCEWWGRGSSWSATRVTADKWGRWRWWCKCWWWCEWLLPLPPPRVLPVCCLRGLPHGSAAHAPRLQPHDRGRAPALSGHGTLSQALQCTLLVGCH